MNIDERLLERRKAVAEERAQRNVGRLLRIIAVLVVVAGVVWAFLSPLLSVHQVRVLGVAESDAHRILASERVVAGTPMIFLRAGPVEEALLGDPWISGATVRIDWPNEVMVDITERVPLAWVETGEGWSRLAIDGVALPSPPTPDDTLPLIHLPLLRSDQASGSRMILGSLEFVDAISPVLRPRVVMTMEGDELWAELDGFHALLGRPIDMSEKARGLEALLRQDLPEGSTLVLVAPTHPAVRPPGLTLPGEEGGDSAEGEEGQDSGGDEDPEQGEGEGET